MDNSRHYAIKHVTHFKYSGSVTESISEIRMQPVTDTRQVCRQFQLTIAPRARATSHTDHLGNIVHYFDIPGAHQQLLIGARSTIEVKPFPDLAESLPESAWDEIDRAGESEDVIEFLLPSRFAEPTDMLYAFAHEHNIERQGDPMSLLRRINKTIYDLFEYAPQSTMVDSKIDLALTNHCGVCQDYSHIMITLLRETLRIPARYVSGYLFHRTDLNDRSAVDATHAWVEAWLPNFGWVGFDPTNNLIAGERHIRVAVGRDYSDVPPTKGVFKGGATSELSVAVQVREAGTPDLEPVPVAMSSRSPKGAPQTPEISRLEAQYLMQQQQQQQ